MAVLLLAGAVLGGEPQCNTDFLSCYYTQIGVRYTDAYRDMVRGAQRGADWLCNATSWRRRELCDVHCPLRMVVTSPPELAENFCMQDNIFSPYVADGHLDEAHPLAGKELEVVALPRDQHFACTSEAFESADYTGKLVMMVRGACYFATKFGNARTANASIGVVVNNQGHDDVTRRLSHMIGSSERVQELPAMMLSKSYGAMLLDAIHAGTKVTAKVEVDCSGLPPHEEDPEGFEYDMCPDVALRPICAMEEAPEAQLCQRCPTEVTLGGAAVCLWGNKLLPFAMKNSLLGVHTAPYTTADGGAVAVNDLPEDGCTLGDYHRHNLTGKVVFMAAPQQCLQWDAVRIAEKAGVGAVVFVGRKSGRLSDMCDGKSKFVNIPVHFIDQTNHDALFAFAAEYGTPLPRGQAQHGVADGAWALPSITFRKGAPASANPILALPGTYSERIPVAEPARAEPIRPFGGEMYVYVVLIALLAGAMGAVLLISRRSHPDLPRATVRRTRGVPLGVASMVLSLSLLVAVASVAFGQATAAGKDATDTAMEDGRAAASVTYENAVLNVDHLALKVRILVIERIRAGIATLQGEGELLTGAVAGMYAGLDDDRWTTFARYHQDLEMLSRAARKGWETKVWTTAGYFASNEFLTDSRTDEERGDGVNGSVAETNNGFLYGVVRHWWNPLTQRGEFWYADKLWYASVFDAVGMERGNPLEYISDLTAGSKRWKMSRHSSSGIFWGVSARYHDTDLPRLLPFSVFQPIYTRTLKFVGAVEVAVPLPFINSIVASAISGEFADNMTGVLFDSATRHVVYNNRAHSQYFPRFVADSENNGYVEMAELRVLTEVPQVEINALNGVLDSPVDLAARSVDLDGTAKVLATTFEQTQHYSYPAFEICDYFVNESSGEWRDHSVEHQRVVLGSGVSVVDDGVLGHRVAEMTKDALIELPQELTVDTPQVAATVTSTSPWQSTSPHYQWGSRLLADGKECVLSEVRMGPNHTVHACQYRKAQWWEPYSVTLLVKPAKEYGVDLDPTTTPRLFADTNLGAGNIRLWGNGQLMLGVLMYGCGTPAFDKPLPVDEWSVITAVSDAKHFKCRVYLNGVLHAEGLRTKGGFQPVVRPQPMQVGQGFEGRIGRVLWLNTAPNDEEAIDLYKQVMRRPAVKVKYNEAVPKREWYVDLSPLTSRSAMSSGLGLTVAVMMPRLDVMRSVERNNERTRANLETQEDNTKKRLDYVLTRSVLVVTLCTLGAVLTFSVFNRLLTRPFSDMAVAMVHVSEMNLDAVEPPRSALTEVHVMNKAMEVMVRNLREFRAFIPKTLLAPESGSSDVEVALVFTDIRSSTYLWDHCQAAMAGGLKLHNSIIRARIADYDGYEIKTIGDAFMLAFSSTEAAVGFGLAIQQDLVEAEWPPELLEHAPAARSEDGAWNGIKIRIGVNWGLAEEIQERGRVDYFGPTVNVAARVEAQCIPGAVCVTDAVMETLELANVGAPVVIEMGERDLKGVAEKANLHLLVPRVMEARADAVRAELEGFTGKQVDNHELERILRRPASPVSWDGSNGSSSGASSLRSSISAVLQRMPSRRAILQHSLDRKRCVVAHTLFQYCQHDLLAAEDPQKMLHELSAAVFSVAEDTKGVVHFLFGATFMLSWQQASLVEAAKNGFAFVGGLPHALATDVAGAFHAFTGVASGRLLVGNIGTVGQRFTTLVGPAGVLSELLRDACTELPASALFACLEGEREIMQRPRLKNLLRPVDTWQVHAGDTAEPQPLVVYQIHLLRHRMQGWTNPLDPPSLPGGLLLSPQADEWGADYWNAFAEKTLDALGSDDPVVAAVHVLQHSERSLRGPIPLSLLALCGGKHSPRPSVSVPQEAGELGSGSGRLTGIEECLSQSAPSRPSTLES